MLLTEQISVDIAGRRLVAAHLQMFEFAARTRRGMGYSERCSYRRLGANQSSSLSIPTDPARSDLNRSFMVALIHVDLLARRPMARLTCQKGRKVQVVATLAHLPRKLSILNTKRSVSRLTFVFSGVRSKSSRLWRLYGARSFLKYSSNSIVYSRVELR